MTLEQTPVYIQGLMHRFFDFLPNLVGASLVLLIGCIVAVVIGNLVKRALIFTGIDNLVTNRGFNERLKLSKNSPYALISNLIGTIVKWTIILATIGVVANILNLFGVSVFIGSILAFLPNIIVAVIILTLGFIAANIASELVYDSSSSKNAQMLSDVAKYSIIVFAIMAALTQLYIVPHLIEIAFGGLVFALALAFGLGGREHASDWIEDIKKGK